MNLLEVACFDPGAAAELRRFRRRRRGTRKAGETFLDIGDNCAVIDRPGSGHDHAGAAIVARQIGAQACRIERSNRIWRAQNGAAHRLHRKCGFLQPVEHEIVGRILGGADFLHDDILLAPQFFGIKGRVRQNVGQDIERQRHVSFEYARKIARLIPRSSQH